MKNGIRRKHTGKFKSQVVLKLLKEEKTTGQIASDFGVHPTQAAKWKTKVLEGIELIFENGVKNEIREKDELIERLYTQIGQLKVEADWLKKKMGLIG
jgi:transposase-like protein